MPDPQGQAPRNRQLTPEHLRQFLLRHPPSPTYWIAYSGGLDSQGLLHLAAGLRHLEPQHRIRAIHVHHGLHPKADDWANHCASTCTELGIDLSIIRVDAHPKRGESPEESARIARYRALQTRLDHNDCVLLAQHRDDQAETLLLQLFRGAGVEGLAAMPAHAELKPGYLARPLLDFSRDQLRDYAAANGLRWIEDDSNRDETFDRNFLRQRILPELRSRWPGLPGNLARSAAHCAEAALHLENRGESLLREVVLDPETNILDALSLIRLERHEQKLVLRRWITRCGFRRPASRILDRILDESLSAATDRNPVVGWKEAEVRRYRDALYLMRPLPPLPKPVFRPNSGTVAGWLAWPAERTSIMLPDGNGSVSILKIAGTTNTQGVALDAWTCGQVDIRYRLGGERIRLPGRNGSHEVRKLYQEAGIPPWVRERIPLIYIDQRLAAVGGYWYAADFQATPTDPWRIVLEWKIPWNASMMDNPKRSAIG
jgi:tRNA(Ile)-lysidine synthase